MNARSRSPARHLPAVAPDLYAAVSGGMFTPALHPASAIRRETASVAMRDGVRLATDLYLPPGGAGPVLAMRTCYGRAGVREGFVYLAERGYVVVSQDCRGTGDSEPGNWDYYLYECEDSLDFVDWVARQDWFGGWLGSLGSSYAGATQWCMARHPLSNAIAPEVESLGAARHNGIREHMLFSAYSQVVGNGAEKAGMSLAALERALHSETLATGFFNESLQPPVPEPILDRYPQVRDLPPMAARRWLWEQYCAMTAAQRVRLVKLAFGEDRVTASTIEMLPAIFGHHIRHGANLIPSAIGSEPYQSFGAPALFITGWYDWWLDDGLRTWDSLMAYAPKTVRTRSRLLITPSSHNAPGYHEGSSDHPELKRSFRVFDNLELLLYWYRSVRDDALDDWPAVTYYLMGANQWRAADRWPPPEVKASKLYLGGNGTLTAHPPRGPMHADTYIYDPDDPTPTVGGSIASYIYPQGSVDVSAIQRRADVLTFTTERLDADLDVAGPLRLALYASSNAVDTDFCARLSDLFPDGRAIQLQSGMLRARYRDTDHAPSLLIPGRVYRFEIDMWATANRFKAGHRIRLDISSADFPRFERNSNLGGEPGFPIVARQAIYHDPDHQSHLIIPVLEGSLKAIQQSDVPG